MTKTFKTIGILLSCVLGACQKEQVKTTREDAISVETTGVMGDCGRFLSSLLAAGDSRPLFEGVEEFARTGPMRGASKVAPQGGRYIEVQVFGNAEKASVTYITSSRIPDGVFVADREGCNRFSVAELARLNHPKTLLEKFYIEYITSMDLHPEISR